jgi:hypothetical protein
MNSNPALYCDVVTAATCAGHLHRTLSLADGTIVCPEESSPELVSIWMFENNYRKSPCHHPNCASGPVGDCARIN